MKKFLLVFLVLVFIPFFNIFSQPMAVIDASLNSLMTTSSVAQYIHYAQMVADNIQQIAQFATMIENMVEQGQRAVQNLASAKDIRSWDDFMDFYNRQLYLERKTAQAFDNINVTIGKKQYHITDIEGMAYGFNKSYVDYWKKEFTPEQEREMWLQLGLTPSNYAYVKPFREKAREITKANLTAAGIQNEWYMRNMQNNKEKQDKLAADEGKDTKNKMGSKEITMMILESLLETNKVLNDIAMNQAIEREEKAVHQLLKQAPNDTPDMSNWSGDEFKKF